MSPGPAIERGAETMAEHLDTKNPDHALLPDLASPTLPATLSPTNMQRLANRAVNHLGLGLVDVAMESREDGKLAIILPEPWAYLLLAHLEATAGQIQEQLRRAMNQARMKDARLQAELAAAAKAWETQQIAIHDRYRQLLEDGCSKREAIRRMKLERQGTMTATAIQRIIECGDPRKRKERKQAFRQRQERIREMADRGMKQKEIARAEGVSRHQVAWALQQTKGGRDAKQDNAPVG